MADRPEKRGAKGFIACLLAAVIFACTGNILPSPVANDAEAQDTEAQDAAQAPEAGQDAAAITPD